MYGIQWPEASRANASTNAIIFKQGGNEVPPYHDPHVLTASMAIPNYNPDFPFKMRGSVDYQLRQCYRRQPCFQPDLRHRHPRDHERELRHPRALRCLLREHAHQAGRRHRPQQPDGSWPARPSTALRPPTTSTSATTSRVTPTMFSSATNKPRFSSATARKNSRRKTLPATTSFHSERKPITTPLAVPVPSCPARAPVRASAMTPPPSSITIRRPPTPALPTSNTPTQRVPLVPSANQSADIYVKVGYQFSINTCFIYYTTDGSNPEGAFGTGKRHHPGGAGPLPQPRQRRDQQH